jgi:ATP synthase I chain
VTNDIDYARSTRRLFWLTLGIGITASVVGWIMGGRRVGLGLGIGSFASLVNLWLWHAVTKGVNPGDKSSKFAAGLFAGRILALFAVGYVMVKYLSIDPRAGIAGLFASSAAVLAEILIELAVGRRLTQ